jgi:hypothetical protein
LELEKRIASLQGVLDKIKSDYEAKIEEINKNNQLNILSIIQHSV